MKSITAITTCKGRLSHLETTLPLMLQAFEDVLVVDWDCPENSGKFAFDIGAKVVYQANEPYFSFARARNLGAKHCSSDFYLFIDADCWVTPYAADSINRLLEKGYQLINGRDSDGFDSENLCGFIGVHREDFWSVGGYCEDLKGFGIEDIYLRSELILKGVEIKRLPFGQLGSIQHNNTKRQQFMKEDIHKTSIENFGKLKALYARNGLELTSPIAKQVLCNPRHGGLKAS